MAKVSQMLCQSFPAGVVKKVSIKYPLPKLPKIAPNPLVIIMNKPCAEERILESVVVSTNKDPEILKKSNANP